MTFCSQRNPDLDIRQLERISFQTKKPEDIINYWNACLRVNILPKPINSRIPIRRWLISRGPYFSLTWEFNPNFREDWPDYEKDHEIIIRQPFELPRAIDISFRTPIEEVEEIVKDDLRKLIIDYQKHQESNRRNPDIDIRQLERKAFETQKSEDIVEYWRASLRTGQLPLPNIERSGSKHNFKGWALPPNTPKTYDQIMRFGAIRWWFDSVGDALEYWTCYGSLSEVVADTGNNAIEEMENKVRELLFQLIEAYDDFNSKVRANPDSDIRQLQRIAATSKKDEDIVAYWKAALRANILPEPTYQEDNFKRWAANNDFKVVWSYPIDEDVFREGIDPEEWLDNYITMDAEYQVNTLTVPRKAPLEKIESAIKTGLLWVIRIYEGTEDEPVILFKRNPSPTGVMYRYEYDTLPKKGGQLDFSSMTPQQLTQLDKSLQVLEGKRLERCQQCRNGYKVKLDEPKTEFPLCNSCFEQDLNRVANLQFVPPEITQQEMKQWSKLAKAGDNYGLYLMVKRAEARAERQLAKGFKRNPDVNIRQLEKIAFDTKETQDIANYWRACLRADIVPRPTLSYGSTKDREIATHVWILARRMFPSLEETKSKDYYLHWKLPSGYHLIHPEESEFHQLFANSRYHEFLGSADTVSEAETKIKEMLSWLLEQYEIEQTWLQEQKIQPNPSQDQRIQRASNKLQAAIESLRAGIPVPPESIKNLDLGIVQLTWKFEDRKVILKMWSENALFDQIKLNFTIFAESLKPGLVIRPFELPTPSKLSFSGRTFINYVKNIGESDPKEVWKLPDVMEHLYLTLIAPVEVK